MRKSKQIYFVCVGYLNKLYTDIIEAETTDTASLLFFNKNGFKPQETLGPFIKKKIKVDSNKMILSSTWKNAEYNDWIVSANLLKEPINYAFLIYKKRIDGKIINKPTGTIVPICDLRILNGK